MLAGILCFGSGCMTAMTIEAARGQFQGLPKEAREGKEKNKGADWREAHYLLLPITVPLDLATLPLQVLLILPFVFGGC
jgi:uncharacterized protein YceK